MYTLDGFMGGMAKGKVANLLVFEIDPQAKLSSVKFYPKTVTNAALPADTAFMGPA